TTSGRIAEAAAFRRLRPKSATSFTSQRHTQPKQDFLHCLHAMVSPAITRNNGRKSGHAWLFFGFADAFAQPVLPSAPRRPRSAAMDRIVRPHRGCMRG